MSFLLSKSLSDSLSNYLNFKEIKNMKTMCWFSLVIAMELTKPQIYVFFENN